MGKSKNTLFDKNIKKYDLLNFKLVNYLPKYGFKSRLSYIAVFLFSILKLHKFLKNEKPDYLIVHLMTFIPLTLLLFFNYKTKIILRISGYPKLNYLRSLFWKIVSKKIHLVTSPTNTTLKLLKESRIFQSEKLKYLPEPVLNFEEIKKKDSKKIFNQKIIFKKTI